MNQHRFTANSRSRATATDITTTKGGTIMTPIYNITGKESTRDLLEIRRAGKMSKRQQRVEQLFGEPINIGAEYESSKKSAANTPNFPLTA